MAPKRKIGESSKSKGKGKVVEDRTFDASRFVSREAQERYEGAAKRNKGFINERGMDFGHLGVMGISDIVERLGWKKFAYAPEAGVSSLVREFYANVPEARDGLVWVRGIEVPFNRSVINSYYGLRDIHNSAYETYLTQVDYEEVINTLTNGCGEWEFKGDLVNLFQAKHLRTRSRIWQYFVCSRLMPTRHYSSVDRERAILQFAIETERSIDVGLVIQQRVVYSAEHHNISYFFPQLITALCVKHGVKYDTGEVLLQPADTLTFAYMQHLTSGSKAGQGSRKGDSSKSTSAKDRMTNIEAKVDEMRQYQIQQQAWLSDHMRYQHDYHALLHNMMSCQLTQSGVDLTQFQPPPQYPGHDFTFIPPASQPEQDREQPEDMED